MIFLILAILILDPIAVCSSGLDGDSLLSLEVHRVHLCANCIFATDFVYRFYSACVIEDSFGDGGFPAVDVGLGVSMNGRGGVEKSLSHSYANITDAR